jgi:uncharacterized protein
MTIEQQLKQITQTLIERIHPEKIVLFGSHASGKATSESDIDLLVIVESDLRRDKRQELISNALRPRLYPIDILAYTPAEVRDCIQDPQSFVNHILKTGKVLYERQGQRMAELG